MLKTRIASLALASVMTLGCTGITAFAAEVEDAATTEIIVDGTIVDDTITDDPITDDPITDDPITDDPITDDPITDDPITDDSITDDPIIDDTVTDDPITDDPITDDPIIDDTVTDDTAADESLSEEISKPVHEKSPDFEKELKKTASDWAIDNLKTAVELGIVPETIQDDFQATNTRAEFCALAVGLYETMMGEEITTLMTFSDTDDINVQKMAGLGVVNGYGDGTFQPETGLNREQAAVILTRLAEVMGYPLDMADADFSDLDTASDWAIDPIGQVQNAEIMSGYSNGQFMPKGLYSREQSIVTVLRLFDMMYVAE